MSRRYHCTFKNCDCEYYIKRNNHRCLKCNHGDVWHSLQEPPSSDNYLSFVSPDSNYMLSKSKKYTDLVRNNFFSKIKT